MTLFRPVGLRELELIAASEWRAFPPRLPIQPIFYPALSADYARQIAVDWNLTDPVSGYAGFITRFAVDDDYVSRFPVQTVGRGGLHDELWVPAEELDEFNRHIEGVIEVIESHYGAAFAGEVDPQTSLPVF